MAFKCGQPHVEGIDAALKVSNRALIASMVEVAEVCRHYEANSRDCQSKEGGNFVHAFISRLTDNGQTGSQSIMFYDLSGWTPQWAGDLSSGAVAMKL